MLSSNHSGRKAPLLQNHFTETLSTREIRVDRRQGNPGPCSGAPFPHPEPEPRCALLAGPAAGALPPRLGDSRGRVSDTTGGGGERLLTVLQNVCRVSTTLFLESPPPPAAGWCNGPAGARGRWSGRGHSGAGAVRFLISDGAFHLRGYLPGLTPPQAVHV